MAAVYSISFSDGTLETTVTSQASEVENWVGSVRSMCNERRPLIVGLGCECKATLSSGKSSKVALLQLCVGNKCLIIQIFYLDHIPQDLSNFLNDASVGIQGNVSKLLRDYGLTVRSASDIGELAVGKMRVVGPYPRGGPELKDYAKVIVGFSMEERPYHVIMSNWLNRELSFQQIEYASVDAYAYYRIGRQLLSHIRLH